LSIEMASELGVTLQPDAADELCDLLNGDLAAVRTEVDKLAAFVGDRKSITGTDVSLLVISSRKYEVWDLTGMLSARRPAEAMKFLDELLRAGEAGPALVGALAWTFRKLLEAQELPASINGWQAASRLKMRAEAAELAVRQSRKFPKSQLTAGLGALYEADSLLKSGVGNPRAVLEFLITQLASPNPA